MTHFNRVLSTIQMRAPGAIDPVIKHELYSVMDEFLEGSNIWQIEHVEPTVAGQLEYPLTLVEQAAVARLMRVVNSDDIPITATLQGNPSTLLLRTAPDTVYNMTVVLALTVTEPEDGDGYPEVPDWIVDKYWRGIADGALARLMSQPAKPYTNTTLAAYHGQRFRQAIAKAKYEANNENLYNGQRWRFPQNFATGRGGG